MLKMNILIDELPQEIDGKQIKSDFRNMILFELMMQDRTIQKNYRIPLAINYLYAEPVDSIKSAVNGLMWFYCCGKPLEKSEGKSRHITRAYDFEQDASYIYAAFLSVYHIDLNKIDYLHWWKFQAMFKSLPESTKIAQIMNYRMTDTSSMKGKEKSFYQRMKHLYRIKSDMQPQQLSVAVQEEKMKQHALDRFAAAAEWLEKQT